jgi:hypothetical protein
MFWATAATVAEEFVQKSSEHQDIEQDEETIWDEMENIFDNHTYPTGGGHGADYTHKNGFFSEIKLKYQLRFK